LNKILQKNIENGVTIVIPVFNHENILGLTLESVLNQTYTIYHCIIVDDCSTDSSVDLARKYQEADTRFQVVENSTNSGACRCRNTGLAMAQSEYVVFLDSDDIWLPQFLETMLASLKKAKSFGAAACQALIYENKIGDLCGTRFAGVSEPINLERYLQEEVAWITSCMLWKTSEIRKIGGFADHLKMWQDWDLNVRYLGTGGMVIPVPHNLLYSKVGGHSQITNQIQGRTRLVNQFFSRVNSWNAISSKALSLVVIKSFADDFQMFAAVFLAYRDFFLSFRALRYALMVCASINTFVNIFFKYVQRTRYHYLIRNHT
jgi:glycosyltransferase involved in cell wall biosynthesis